MKVILLIPLVLIPITSYGSERDKDGVPIVDLHGKIVTIKPATVTHGIHFPEHKERFINVDGKQMSIREFLLTYCMGKDQNETCSRAQMIGSLDGISGPKEDLPKGL